MRVKTGVLSYLIFIIILVALAFISLKSQKIEPNQLATDKKAPKFITKTLDDGYQMKKYVPKGVQIINEDLMEPGLTLVPMFLLDQVELINHQGEVINRWDVRTKRARLLKNCNLVVVHKRKKEIESGKIRNTLHVVSEYDWSGNLIREFKVDGEVHHDTRMFNKQNLMILHRYYAYPNDPKLNYPNLLEKYPSYRIKYDAIDILDYKTGEQLFHWNFLNSYKANSCGGFGCPWKSPRFIRADKDHIDWTHINSVSEIPENRWYQAGNQAFRPGNLMLTVRNWSAILILDRESGQIVWEYNGDKQGIFEGGHDAYLIPEGLNGAGNILMFDNGDPRLKWNRRPYKSRVLEINPITQETVWMFDDEGRLFSQSMGSAERLKNGNTLISQDSSWRILEVNNSGEILWQYNAEGHTSRANRYPPNYCSEFPKN